MLSIIYQTLNPAIAVGVTTLEHVESADVPPLLTFLQMPPRNFEP